MSPEIPALTSAAPHYIRQADVTARDDIVEYRALRGIAGIAVFLLVGFFTPQKVDAAAWTLKEGAYNTYSNFIYYSADTYRSGGGDKVAIETYEKYEFAPRIEYGLSDKITLGGSASLQKVSQGEDNWGVGDTEIYARIKAYEAGGVTLSVQPLLKTPRLYDSEDLPPIGSNQFDAEMRGLAGYSWNAFGMEQHAGAEAAFRYRMEYPANQVSFDATYGIKPNEKTMLLGQVFSAFATGDDANAVLISPSQDYDLVKLQISGLYILNNNVALQLGGFADVHARNTSEGAGALFSVWNRF